MTKDEALRLALEALENLGNHDHVCPQWPTYAEPENYPKCNCGYDQAITAIKAALEAPQRTWVGLTAEEREQVQAESYGKVPHHVALIAAVEAKLKERNS